MSFDNMGKPIPLHRKENAYQEARLMGVDNPDERMSLVNSVAEFLERDKSFEAQKEAMKILDLTGSYRLFAALLAG